MVKIKTRTVKAKVKSKPKPKKVTKKSAKKTVKKKTVPKVEKENNYLYKFSYYGDEKENVKAFVNCFKSFNEATIFIDNLVATAIDNYSLIKTVYYNQTVNDKYEDDDTIDDITESFEPLFNEDVFKKINNVEELRNLLLKSKKRTSTAYLLRYKNLIALDSDYTKKLNAFVEVLKDSNFYIISNKEKIKEIPVNDLLFKKLLNNNEIKSEHFLKNKDAFHLILNTFGEVKRAKKSTSTNELNFVHKSIVLKNNNQRIIIEESRKKTILENKLEKFTYNFIAFKTNKKLKKKALQIFEMLNDESKIALINTLR